MTAAARVGWLTAVIAPLLLAGCATGRIGSITITSPVSCDPATNICGIERLDPVKVAVRGTGQCGAVQISFGDSSFPLVEKNVDFSKGPLTAQHYFDSGWVGPKRIRASTVSDCVGDVSVIHHVFQQNSFRENHMIGWIVQGAGQYCWGVPMIGGTMPPLRTGTKVSVVGTTTPVINFGCPLNGCIYDPDGQPNSSAPAGFWAPGLRAYSLVLQIGTQIVQGGTMPVVFFTNQTAELTLCLNTNSPYGNSGGWEVDIAVDESVAQ